ncbi:MAG: hypothetical protein AAF721_17350 [Myxococcota bacterium]
METIPLPLIIGLILAAVVFGLWVGHRAGQMLPADDDGKKKSLGARVRGAATDGVIKLWKWNRKRKKEE